MPVLKARINGEFIEIATGSADGGSGGSTVDSKLSTSSINPIQNKAVATAINELRILVGTESVETQIKEAMASLRNLEEVHF